MKKFVFIADLFVEDYVGEPELTTEALIKNHKENFIVKKIRCSELEKEHIIEMTNAHWIVCNFSQLSLENKLLMCKKLNYSIIEYDYKFCKYSSLEMDRIQENTECDYASRQENKINLVFYGMAKKIWFMSNRQKEIFLDKVKTVDPEKTEAINSVFSEEDLNLIKLLKDNPKDEAWAQSQDKCFNNMESRISKFWSYYG